MDARREDDMMNPRNAILAAITMMASTTAINAQAAEYIKCTGTSGKTIYTNMPYMCADAAKKAQEATKAALAAQAAKEAAAKAAAEKAAAEAKAAAEKAAALKAAAAAVKANALTTDAVFSADSFWYTPIPKDVELHPYTAQYTQEFLRQKKAYYNTVNINTAKWSSPVYVADSNTAPVRVNQWDCQKKGYKDSGLLTQWASVPVPSYAVPAEGTDMEMTVYQPSTDTVWEFWKAKKENGVWYACWGGRLENASKSNGVFNKYYGTTATSLPFLGGQITAEELARGEIKHAIGISMVDLEHWNVFSWPANRSDGWNSNKVAYRIAEGQRFRLDPTIDVDKLNLTKVGKIIAKAAQTYGFVVWDKAGSISLRAQNVYSYTKLGKENPYPALFENKPNYAVLNNFPWESLQFLPIDYGKPETTSK
jgi:hypothetical protein